MAEDDAYRVCSPPPLEEYDFTVHHRPSKIQTHVDGLSRLPVGLATSEEEARRLAQELHSAINLGGQALWKLFSDRYFHKAGRRLCIEVAQSCPQCQLGRRLRSPPEDNRVHTVQRAVGHALSRYCGSTPCRSPT